MLWTVFATFAERTERGFLSYRVAYLLGILLSVGILSAYLYAATHPYTRPLFIGMRG